MEDLIKKFKASNREVWSCKWELVLKIIESLNNEEAKVISVRKSCWAPYHFDLKNYKTWQAFERDISLEFYLDDNFPPQHITCYAKQFRDSIAFGRDEVFYVQIQLPINFVQYLERDIEWLFDAHLEDEHEKYLQAKKDAWKKKMEKKILGNQK